MAVKIGISGIPSAAEGQGAEAGIAWLAQHDLQEELQFVRSIWMTEQKARELKAKNYAIDLSIHAPYYINLCNPAKLAASKKRILDSAKRAEILGASPVVIHPGYYGNDKEKAFEMIVRAFKDLTAKTSAPLGLETMGRQAQFGTLEETLAVCEQVPSCVPVIDFSHMYARNNGHIDYAEVLEKTKKYKHLHAHFSGIAYAKGNERHHLPVTTRQPDFEPLARELVKRKTDITIICESPFLERDALLMKRIVEKTAP